MTKRDIQLQAINAVGRAIRKGELPRLDGSIACVDCGHPATEYDHRDYTKPLEVEPVCHSCNKKRGAALPVPKSILLTPKPPTQYRRACDNDHTYRTYSLVLPTALIERISRLAQARQTSRSEMTEHLIKQGLADKPEKARKKQQEEL